MEISALLLFSHSQSSRISSDRPTDREEAKSINHANDQADPVDNLITAARPDGPS